MKVYNAIVESVRNFWENPPLSYRVMYRWEELSEEQLLAVMQINVKQQRPWVVGFPRWLGNIYGNCPEVEIRRMLLEDMDDEDFKDKLFGDGHVGLQRRLALALGLSEADLDEGPFVPEVMAVYHSMDNISRTRPWLEAIACVMGTETLTIGRIPKLYPDMEEYDSQKGGVTGPALKIFKKLGLKTEDLAFFWAHDLTRMAEWEGKPVEQVPKGTEAKHQAYVIKTLTEYAKTDEQKRQVIQAAQFGHQLYWLRWNGVGRAMQEYLEKGMSPYGALRG
jgi:pyrroloquinoline quinone (PQQ) biosynthesis protein C